MKYLNTMVHTVIRGRQAVAGHGRGPPRQRRIRATSGTGASPIWAPASCWRLPGRLVWLDLRPRFVAASRPVREPGPMARAMVESRPRYPLRSHPALPVFPYRVVALDVNREHQSSPGRRTVMIGSPLSPGPQTAYIGTGVGRPGATRGITNSGAKSTRPPPFPRLIS